MALAAAASSLSLGPKKYCLCHPEGVCCSASHGITSSRVQPTFYGRRALDVSSLSFRCRNPLFGSTQLNWLSTGHDLCSSKVFVAADYPDSLPESSNYIGKRGYHPLEELETPERIWEPKLTTAETARTAIEANSSAFLVFPGMVHSEPHEQMSWAELPYVVDDFGDIFFEIRDPGSILQDRGASNPVNALIGMDIPTFENRRTVGESNNSGFDGYDDFLSDDDYFEVMDSEISESPLDWGMPDATSLIHPIYFSKCLRKAINAKCEREMLHPRNGVSILGCLRPAFADDASYLRSLFRGENSDDYDMEWEDGELWSSDRTDGDKFSSTLFRLEIMRVELFSVYGVQSVINLRDFQDAEADVLANSSSAIAERFKEKGFDADNALKALCKKKGFYVQGANLIGVDSLGIDVRVYSGVEMRTHRFPFKFRVMKSSERFWIKGCVKYACILQVTSVAAAEKQILRLLFPRSRRRKLKTTSNGLRQR